MLVVLRIAVLVVVRQRRFAFDCFVGSSFVFEDVDVEDEDKEDCAVSSGGGDSC